MSEKTQKKPEDLEENQHEHAVLAKIGMFFLELIKIVVLAAVTIVLIRYFLFKPFYVKGQSMEPSFYEKDYLIIDEITYRFRGAERGEVVVFQSPVNTDHYLKRIVGLPGERIKIHGNKVVVYNEEHPKGVVVDEDYLEEGTEGSVSVSLGPDEYFVLGDNRDASYDSRRFGPIPENNIIGRVWFRGWPFTRITSFNDAPDYNFIK